MPQWSTAEYERARRDRASWWYNAPLYIAYPETAADKRAQREYLAMSLPEREEFKRALRTATGTGT